MANPLPGECDESQAVRTNTEKRQQLHDLCIIAAGVSRTLRVEPETGKKRLLNGLEVAERCASIYHHLKKKAEGGL